MSEIESCPLCESPLVDSALERAFDGTPFKRCSNRECSVLGRRKEHCPRRLMGEHQEPHMPCDTGDHSRDYEMTPEQQLDYQRYMASPAGTARALIEARAEIERMKSLEPLDERLAMRDALIEAMRRERDKAINAAAGYRLALEDMVNQWGGDETCMSANEDAVEALESSDVGKSIVDELARLHECIDREFKRRRDAETKNEAAESQIAALKVDLAAMQKERDTANRVVDALREFRVRPMNMPWSRVMEIMDEVDARLSAQGEKK